MKNILTNIKQVFSKIMNMKIMNINMKYIFFITIIVIGSLIYGVYKDKRQSSIEDQHYKLVREYLLNDHPLVNKKKPLLWIHLDYRINARDWISFNSRNSNNLNQPYLYLTIKSIVDKCGNDFNICIIDDNTFINILPNWNIELNSVADPIKKKLRLLALMNVLQIYGGMLLPASFFCIKSMKNLYNKLTEESMFVGDFLNKNITSMENNLYVNNRLIGCKRDCNKMKDFINHIQVIISKDHVNESEFTGSIDKWLESCMNKNEISLLNSEMLGLVSNDNKLIILDDLMNNTFIDLHKDAHGIYIPSDEILLRKKYQWFARLSPEQVLKSNTLIGKYILINMNSN